MLKKIIIGVLLFSVIGAAGAAYAYNALTAEPETAATGPAPLTNGESSNSNEKTEAGKAITEAQGAPMAEGMAGEPWQASGTIVEIDANGFDFLLDSGETVYVELGPSNYWQSQDVELAPGQAVRVEGSINEDMMIHASQVTLADDQVLALRSESGQPLWSGGASNSRDQNGGQGDGDHTPDPKANVDEWITLEGTLMSFQGGNMTMSTADGALVSFQTGQPRFLAEQGVTFQVGDQISVLGFYEGEQFSAGEITQLSTGLRVMLRDPNGRPLWAGPGNNGNGGNGNSGNQQGNGGANH
jgi:hypothetical protein